MSEKKPIDLSGDGGVLKEIVQEGISGERGQNGWKAAMHYTGKFTDGTIFDSSVGKSPFEFELGRGHVIKAFDMGVASMQKGEKCILTCAPEYAYGVAGSPPSIPPNTTLIFELELLGWKGQDLSPLQDGGIEKFTIVASDKKQSPREGSTLKIHLIGKYDEKIFEEREVEFDHGEGSDFAIVEGIEIGLEKMKVGETSKFVIRSDFAFGKTGSERYNIPPNATVEYTVKLLEAEKGYDKWRMTEEEKIEQFKSYKDKGNKYFKKENYKLAIKMYEHGIDISSDVSDSNAPDGTNEIKQMKAAVYSNIALCHLKLNQQFEGKLACNKALEIDEKHIKALYRRGQCNLAINECEAAIEDFRKVVEYEPNNKAALQQISICKQKIKEIHNREKRVYANMFTKLAAADKETDRSSEADVLTKCGEWTEEDAKREADLRFERDNNIVMI